MSKYKKTTNLYPHPFSKGYWKDALAEMKDIKMLVFAALMIALRVAMKGLAIPLAPSLKINTAFFVNALGAMVFGPVMSALGACVSDVLGFLIWPQEGPYFPPFILTEVAGSVIFALFLYRAKATPTRVMLSRFCICFFVNVVLQTPIMMWYYALYMGGKSYVLTVPGILKNLFMFPIESVTLTLFLSALLPVTNRLKLTYGTDDPKVTLRFTKRQLALLLVLVVIGTGCVFGYLTYHYNTTSLSASYTTEEREVTNRQMLIYVRANSNEYDSAEVVTIVESAKKPFLGHEVTYTVAVYGGTDIPAAAWKYSKSKAAQDETLERLATATLVVDEKTGSVLSFQLVQIK